MVLTIEHLERIGQTAKELVLQECSSDCWAEILEGLAVHTSITVLRLNMCWFSGIRSYKLPRNKLKLSKLSLCTRWHHSAHVAASRTLMDYLLSLLDP